jgi:predicted Zn-dependent protease
MDYEAKTIPEGINTSKEHPLRELAILLGGISMVIIIVTSLLALSTDYLIQYIPVEKENQWFANDALAGLQAGKPASNSTLAANVEAQLQQIIEQLRPGDKPDFRFTVKLLESDVPNAFIVPGGHIFVTSALLQQVESENGLAMVLAHEMGHHYHRHPLRGLGRALVISLALMVISGTDNDSLVQGFVGNTVLLTSLSFNRDQEREADNLGVELLVKRYGHASGASEFFESMKGQPESSLETPEFMESHPGVGERIDMLQQRSRQSSGEKTSLADVVVEYRAKKAKKALN